MTGRLPITYCRDCSQPFPGVGAVCPSCGSGRVTSMDSEYAVELSINHILQEETQEAETLEAMLYRKRMRIESLKAILVRLSSAEPDNAVQHRKDAM